MSQRTKAALLAFMILAVSLRTVPMLAQQAHDDDIVRRAKSKVEPEYPELARKMNIAGTVKIAVVVAPNGNPATVHTLTGESGNSAWTNLVQNGFTQTLANSNFAASAHTCRTSSRVASGLRIV